MKDIRRMLKIFAIVEDIYFLLLIVTFFVLLEIALELLLGVKYDLKTSIVNLPKVGFGAALYHLIVQRKK